MKTFNNEQEKIDFFLFLEKEFSVLTDNRFAVINGQLIDLTTYELDTGEVYAVILTHDATDVSNASYGSDLSAIFCTETPTSLSIFETLKEANDVFIKFVTDGLNQFDDEAQQPVLKIG